MGKVRKSRLVSKERFDPVETVKSVPEAVKRTEISILERVSQLDVIVTDYVNQ